MSDSNVSQVAFLYNQKKEIFMSKGNSFRGVSDYNIGLDIGTNSVGWAVVDPNGNFYKFKGRTMGGVVLIHQKGETAASRRSFRSSRRRLQRKKNRIRLVQELMGEMVLKEAFRCL